MIWLFVMLIIISLFWQLEHRRSIRRAEAHREKQEALTELLMKLNAADNNHQNKDHEQGTES